MNIIEKQFINNLLDKYEKSKKYNNSSKVNRKISLLVHKVYPDYLNESDYEVFININEALEALERQELVVLKRNHDQIQEVILVDKNIEVSYNYINRQPKKTTDNYKLDVLTRFENINDCLQTYIDEQKQALRDNKSIKFYSGNIGDYEKFLRAIQAVLANQEEIYAREFSIKLFGDSKTFERMESKIRNFLVLYAGEVNVSNSIENYNIVKNPASIHIKGNAILAINGERVNIGSLCGGIAVISIDLDKIEKIELFASQVVTIENLTTYYTFNQNDSVVVYVGGYPSIDKCKFIKKIFENNPALKYYHFGDIDAGGIEIFNTLCRKTDIEFFPYKMGTKELKMYKSSCRTLTKLDVKRLINLKCPKFNDVIEYMLHNNCKLEQEIIETN